jgi:hypothetical protein
MTRLIAPAVVVLMVVAGLVAVATWNRTSEPWHVLTVTERELSLVTSAGLLGGDDRAPRLRLQFEQRADPLEARTWLSHDRLRLLGFALHVPPGAPEAAETYRKALPRTGWVVLEYDGPAFAAIDRTRALRREAEGWRELQEPSRLVPVDAGPDATSLRERYAAGHLVVGAVFQISYVPTEEGGPLVYGWLREVVPSTLTIPRHLRPAVEGLAPLFQRAYRGGSEPVGRTEPRYAADIATGPLGVPYVRALRLLN